MLVGAEDPGELPREGGAEPGVCTTGRTLTGDGEYVQSKKIKIKNVQLIAR